MRLDEDKLEALRRWGEGLRQAGGEEYAAAGRAILMLIEEIERLRLELSRVDEELGGVEPVSSDEAGEDREEPVASALHDRLERVLRRGFDSGTGPEPVEEGSGLESDRTTTSPQSWIEALRRHR
jgi:regulator of replication initiation timing